MRVRFCITNLSVFSRVPADCCWFESSKASFSGTPSTSFRTETGGEVTRNLNLPQVQIDGAVRVRQIGNLDLARVALERQDHIVGRPQDAVLARTLLLLYRSIVGRIDAGKQQAKLHEVTAIEGEVNDLPPIYDGAHG